MFFTHMNNISPSDVYCSCIAWFSALCPGFCSCYWRFSPFCIHFFANARQQKSVFWGTFPLFFLFFFKRKLFFDCIWVFLILIFCSSSLEFLFSMVESFCKGTWNPYSLIFYTPGISYESVCILQIALQKDSSSFGYTLPVVSCPATFRITHAILFADFPSAVILTEAFSVFICHFPIHSVFHLIWSFHSAEAYHLSVLRISIRFI